MKTDGPTRGAGEHTSGSWGSRPGLARVVKAVTVLLPIACAVGITTLVGPSLVHPAGVGGTLLWIVQLAALSTATVVVVDRFARRLVPLAGLLNLSLVFPDEAPSRFGVALKSGTTKRLQAELAERPDDETTNESATRLLGMVSELNAHDRLTRGHTERVRAYSDLIAEEMDLSDDDRWKLRWAVLLHDIGKLTVPPEILNKEGRPDEAEWAILRNHPAAGAEMVEPLADWLGDWRRSAGEHHERWDGHGYPLGLAGEEISLAGRIVAVADAYDVITSARSYKRPTDPAVAREELVRCAGTQFDPAVVRAFLNVSLGRLRLVGGPLAWLASLPMMGNLPGTIAAAATNAAVAASVVVSTVVGGAIAPSSGPTAHVQPVAAVADGVTRGGTPVAARARGTRPAGTGAATGAAGEGATSTTVAMVPVDTNGDGVVDAVVPAAPEPTDGSDPAAGPSSQPEGGSVGTSPEEAPGAPSVTTTTRSARAVTTTSRPAPTTTPPPATTSPPVTTPPPPVGGPTAVADTVSVGTAAQKDIDVLKNDIAGSEKFDKSIVTILVPPAHAASYEVRADRKIRYRSVLLFIGVDTLTYQVCDTTGRCSVATLTIDVGLL